MMMVMIMMMMMRMMMIPMIMIMIFMDVQAREKWVRKRVKIGVCKRVVVRRRPALVSLMNL